MELSKAEKELVCCSLRYFIRQGHKLAQTEGLSHYEKLLAKIEADSDDDLSQIKKELASLREDVNKLIENQGGQRYGRTA